MKMRRLLLVLILFILFVIDIDVYAIVEAEINPEWEYYMSLSEEEKNNYSAIPEQYIYEYKRDIKNNANYFNTFGKLEYIPRKFSLADVEGKIYSNTVSKDQASLGLCWAFAGLGSAESNMLLNGVVGWNEMISKCTDDNSDVNYCKYKNDYDQNEKYKNKEVSQNVTFSERNVDYILSKPANAEAYNTSSGTYTIVKEEYNPYSNSTRKIGSGGTFSNVNKLYMYGLAPIKTLNEWATYNTKMTTMTLEQIYDSVGVDYVVTNTYNYPSKPKDEATIKEWQDELKSLIIKYGSTYVSTVAPQTSSARACYYYNSKDKTYLINYDGDCGEGSLGWHAMQIIGWDDDYSFGYCKTGSTSSGNYTQESCEEAGYKWASGTGVWLIKNSWGSSKTYVYLSYDSINLSISGVRGVMVADFDNRYNKVISNVKKTQNGTTKIYKYYKSDENEYLSHISVNYSSYGAESKVYISNDGENYDLVATDNIDLSGMRAYSLKDYKLDENNFYVKIESSLSISEEPSVFTKNECSYLENCSSNVEVESYIEDEDNLYKIDEIINLKTKTRNIKSGAKIEYKILNEENIDVTDKFSIKNNYLILSDNAAEITVGNLKTGKYKIRTSYGSISDDYEINIINNNFIKLSVRDDIMVSDKTAKVEYTLESNEGNSNFRWISSDESIATIDKNGVMTILKGGRTTVTLTVSTLYGDISNTIDVIIYDEKISTVDEFLDIFETGNNTKSYLLVNDLDFNGINYSPSSTVFNGIFNGGFHTIKNINASGSYRVGLFGSISNSIVKNIIIKDSKFVSSASYAGGVAGYAYTSEISNVFVDSVNSGFSYVGGIVGYGPNSNCIQCVFEGSVTADSTSSTTYGGGIFGRFSNGVIEDSYNTGDISVTSSYTGTATKTLYASGIGNGTGSSSIINRSYSVGSAKASNGDTLRTSGIAYSSNAKVTNSYYLENSGYTEVDANSRTSEQLLNKANYFTWDFDNIWYIDNNYPVLRVFPTKITSLKLDILGNIINTNSEYDLKYIIEPYGNSSNVVVEALTPDLITIENNKIKTGNTTGNAKIRLTLGDYSAIQTFEIKELLLVNYNKNYTNSDLSIEFIVNYFLEDMSDGYLKLNYMIGDINNDINITEQSKEVNIVISENGTLKYTLYYCKDTCKKLFEGSNKIKEIDKEKPNLLYEYDRVNKELTITVSDSISGINSSSEYLYGISNSNTERPSTMTKFENGKKIKNKTINYKNKYLWIKNIQDNVGNNLCDSEYCIYDLNVPREKYNVYYYDEDKETLLKTESYYEDEKIVTYIPSKDDDNYYYEFINWDGYVDDMIITDNINLYAKYNKISKKIVSSVYKIDDNYIRDIRLKDIYDKYYYSEFLKNILYYDGFTFDNEDNFDELYLKTGMEYKSKYRSYKIVLMGDVTGDGSVKMNDIMKIANHLIDGNTLQDEYLYAADVMTDGNIKMNDLMKIATTIVNGGEL